MQINSNFTLEASGTLINASVLRGSRGLGVVANGGTLEGVTLAGNLIIESGALAVTNGLTLNSGTVTFDDVNTSIDFDGSQTLGGTGTVQLSGVGNMVANTDAMTLTIGTGITIQDNGNPPADPALANFIGSSGQSGGGSNTSIVNQGSINVNSSAVTISSNGAGTFTNGGTINVSNGGYLSVADLAGNEGNLSLAGSASVISLNGNYTLGTPLMVNTGATLSLNGSWTNTSSLTISGSLNLNGSIAEANLGTINNTGGVMTIAGVLDNTGATLALSGSTVLSGTIVSGTITGTGGAQLLSTHGTLNGATVSASLPLVVNPSLTVNDGLTLNSTLSLPTDASGNGTSVTFFGTQTLAGSGTIILGGAAFQPSTLYCERALFGDPPPTLTIGPNIVIQGGNGEILSINSIDNQGTINANVAGQTIQILALSGINSGLLEASGGGILDIDASMTTANLGSFSGVTGTLEFSSFLNNTGSTLALTAATGPLLFQGTLSNGTVAGAGGAQFVCSNAELDGVTLDADTTAASGTTLTVKDGLTVNGTLTMANANSARLTQMFCNGTQTLSGSGTIFFGGVPIIFGSSAGAANEIFAQGDDTPTTGTTLTIGPNITIHGSNGIIGAYYSQDSIINEGTVVADIPGIPILIGGTNWINSGLLKATNGGTLSTDGSTTTADLGMLAASGGTIDIGGTLDNSGNIFMLTAATGSINLSGTIIDGTVAATGAAQLIAAGGILDAVTLDATVAVGNSSTLLNTPTLIIKDGLTLNGAMNVASTGKTTAVNFMGTQTLSGTGTIFLDGTSNLNYIYAGTNGETTGTTLTIAPSIIIGGDGFIDGLNNLDALIIQGTVNANVAGQSIVISASNCIDTGLLEANNGATISLGTLFINGQGALSSDVASTIKLNGNLFGNTINSNDWLPQGGAALNIAGTSSMPQMLEAMSQDEGTSPEGFENNFAYSALSISPSNYVWLVDKAQNATAGSNAVYAASLSGPIGSTLDLNGFHIYTLANSFSGTVINGVITVVPAATLPDLSPQNASAIDTAGFVAVSWDDVNAGGSNVINSFTDQVQLIDVTQNNLILDTRTPFYNETINGPISSAGGEVPQQASFNLQAYPQFQGSDTLQVVIITDVKGNVFEPNDGDKQTSIAVTHSKAMPTLSVGPAPAQIIYDGTSDVTNWAVATLSGLAGATPPSGLPTLTFFSGTSTTGDPLSSLPVNVGKYTVIANYPGDANYTSAQSNPITFTIIPAFDLWTGGGDGTSWSNASNWTGGVIPTSNYNATIPGGLSIKIGGGAYSAASLTSLSSVEILPSGLLKIFGVSAITGSLSIDSGGSFDIQSNPFIVNYISAANDPIGTVRGYLHSAYAGGSWSGTGLTSSVASSNPGKFAIGYTDNTSTNQLTYELTVPGDTNLSGSTDFNDLTAVAQFFGTSVAKGNVVDWQSGDVNYDGQVDFNDLTIVAQYFGDSLAKANASLAAASDVATASANPIAANSDEGVSSQATSSQPSPEISSSPITRIPIPPAVSVVPAPQAPAAAPVVVDESVSVPAEPASASPAASSIKYLAPPPAMVIHAAAVMGPIAPPTAKPFTAARAAAAALVEHQIADDVLVGVWKAIAPESDLFGG